MQSINELRALERSLHFIEGRYDSYLKNKDDLEGLPKKKDREKARIRMIGNTEAIHDELKKDHVLVVISDGKPYQFEDFIRFVESDLPCYITKIRERINELKCNKYDKSE